MPAFINNVDVLVNPQNSHLSSLRQTYVTTNFASVAVVATDFLSSP